MRIAISGVAGTGKTTLCKLISSETGLEFVPDINDVVLNEMGYEDDRELYDKRGDEGHIDWHIRAIIAKINHDVAKDNYVADKSVFDFAARSLVRIYPNRREFGINDEQHGIIMDALQKGIHLYDRIFYMPLGDRPVEDNKMRTVDSKQRFRFNVALLGLYSAFGVDIEPYSFDFSDSPSKVLKDLGIEDVRNGQ